MRQLRLSMSFQLYRLLLNAAMLPDLAEEAKNLQKNLSFSLLSQYSIVEPKPRIHF